MNMKKKKILVIDDDPDLVETTCIVLQANGYETATASGGREGITKLESVKPDLIILDVMMETYEEGFAVAHEIRKKGIEIPIIMLSAVGKLTGYKFSESDNPDFLPVSEFLEKPVKPNILIEKIKKLIG